MFFSRDAWKTALWKNLLNPFRFSAPFHASLTSKHTRVQLLPGSRATVNRPANFYLDKCDETLRSLGQLLCVSYYDVDIAVSVAEWLSCLWNWPKILWVRGNVFLYLVTLLVVLENQKIWLNHQYTSRGPFTTLTVQPNHKESDRQAKRLCQLSTPLNCP